MSAATKRKSSHDSESASDNDNESGSITKVEVVTGTKKQKLANGTSSKGKDSKKTKATGAKGNVKTEDGDDAKDVTEQPTKNEGKKDGRGKGGSSWSPEQDTLLSYLIRQNSKDGKTKWKPIEDGFKEQFPGQKTLKAMKMRYENALKGADVDLDDEEKKAFYQCVSDIDNNKFRQEAIAWRFGTVTKKPLTKSGVGKLLKAMKSWNIDALPENNDDAERNDDSEGEESEVKTEAKVKAGTGKKKPNGKTEVKEEVGEVEKSKGKEIKAEPNDEKKGKGTAKVELNNDNKGKKIKAETTDEKQKDGEENEDGEAAADDSEDHSNSNNSGEEDNDVDV